MNLEQPEKIINIGYEKSCDCKPSHLNCLTGKEWVVNQLGVWKFSFTKQDVRDKKIHPATFPLALCHKIIKLFSHEGELVLDPFSGIGTTLVAAKDLNRNAIGFDLKEEYINYSKERVKNHIGIVESRQESIWDDARNISSYLPKDSVKLIWTSPPYANMLNRIRKNKSRRSRGNEQLGLIEQYSQDERDLGTYEIDKYSNHLGSIFEMLLPILKPKGHCVINVPDMWMDNKRITIHISVIDEMRRRGYELRNIIIWDRTNIVNGIGIFGYPSNYITMGVTFEYLLDFWRPPQSDT